MPSDGTDPTFGSPTFSETLAPAFGTDLSEVARYAGRGGPFRPGTTAERNAASGAAAREGVYWSDTSNGELYKRVSGSWVLVPMARTVFGHAGMTTVTSPPAGFQNMSGGKTANIELQDASGGVTVSQNALIVPVTARYQVNARFYYSGSAPGTVRGEIRVNDVTRVQSRTFKDGAEDHTAPVSQIMLLAAGDKLTLWSNYGSSLYGTDGYNGTYIEALRVA